MVSRVYCSPSVLVPLFALSRLYALRSAIAAFATKYIAFPELSGIPKSITPLSCKSILPVG
jgi:hypothetical protein